MKLLICSGAGLLILGIILVLVPVHVYMTGYVLLLLGAAMVLCGVLHRRPGEKVRSFVSCLTILSCVGVVCLMSAMNLITTSGQPDWTRAQTADYAIVLGAKVNADGNPSRIMRSRLHAAVEFLERNPDAVVIVSGGQGDDEPMTEAKCMYDTLIDMGVSPSRLIQEGESHTTRENLLNSMDIIADMGGTDMPIALITSEFHQRRADYIASSLNLDTCPVSAHTDQWFYRVNYTLREVFAFVKAAIQAN